MRKRLSRGVEPDERLSKRRKSFSDFNSPANPVCAICDGKTQGGKEIQCDSCNAWFHFQCVGVEPCNSILIDLCNKFVCPSCCPALVELGEGEPRNVSLFDGLPLPTFLHSVQEKLAMNDARRTGNVHVGVATRANGLAIDPITLAKVDFTHLVSLALSTSGRKAASKSGGVTAITGGVTEIFVSGEKGSALFDEREGWLMNQPNPNDGEKPYREEFGKLLKAVKGKAKESLGRLCNYSDYDLQRVDFASFSLLVHSSCSPKPPQPPHIDLSFNQAQFIMGCSPYSKSTYVYTGEVKEAGYIEEMADYTATEAAIRPAILKGRGITNDMLPYMATLFQDRRSLVDKMKPALTAANTEVSPGPAYMQPGEFAVLSGPVIHGGPENDAGVFRAVLFFTSYLRGESLPYNPDFQLLPYIAAEYVNSAKIFLDNCREWRDYAPWNHFTSNFAKSDAKSRELVSLLEKYSKIVPGSVDEEVVEERVRKKLRQIHTEQVYIAPC